MRRNPKRMFRAERARQSLDLAAMAAEATGVKFEPGKVYDVNVYHDDDCPALTGGGCDCEPDFRVKELE